MLAVVRRFAPPLLLMGVIFFLSSRPHLGSDLGALDLVLRKFAHMLEYGLLVCLWVDALGSFTAVLLREAADRRAVAMALVITVLYAISDEVHQTFVDGRHGSAVDVVIDTTGMVLGLLALRFWLLRRDRA